MHGVHDYKITAALGMALLLTLASCSKESSPVAAGSTTTKRSIAPTKRGPTVDELTQGMVQATPLGKSALPLELKFDLGSKPVKGQPLEINVALVPLDAGNQTTVTLTSLPGFDTSDPKSFDVEHLEVGEVYRHTLHVTPSAEGVLLVGLNVTVQHDDVTDSKEFSIPVIVEH